MKMTNRRIWRRLAKEASIVSAAPSSHSTSPAQTSSAINTRPPRILIADDNPQGVELLEAYLGDTDYAIQTAMDGEETLAKVREWKPDLILLDIMMPKISGFEVC